MTDQVPGESAVEVVLDNRKLILLFAVLMALCIVFFVLGFVEGKRQGAKLESDKTERAHLAIPAASQSEAKVSPDSSPAKAVEGRPVREQLDWYKNVNQKTEPVTRLPEPAGKVSSVAPGAKVPSPVVKDKSTGSSGARNQKLVAESSGASHTTYSLQIGAFRQRQEAETAAATLKTKGYRCLINPPSPGESYYRLKVGQFESRADAIAMQLKLKKDGFATLIKTN